MQRTFTTSDGARLTYLEQGEGDVLVVLPGWSQSAAMFRHQMEYFSKSRRVVALDFRGHGASANADRGHRIHRFAADVAELLEHAGVERASMLGWSMGASVLWAYIDLFGTHRIDRLILVDEPASVMRQPGMSDDEAIQAGALFDAATMAAIAAQIAGPDGHGARSAFLDSMVTKAIPADLRAFLLAENLRADPRDIAALFVNHCSLDWRDVIRRIDRPTLVIGGRVSHVDARSQAWIHAQIATSELVIFEEADGGAHFPFIEAPDTFNRVLGRFLDADASAIGTAAA
jgi:non-heme chloroperoxidase